MLPYASRPGLDASSALPLKRLKWLSLSELLQESHGQNEMVKLTVVMKVIMR